MNFHLLCAFGILILCYSNFAKAGLSDDVKNLLEEFRKRMCHPFPQWDLPALDPFEVSHEEVELDGNILKNFSASVTNLKATGLSDFFINDVKISVLTQKFTFDLTFPFSELKSRYTAKGSVANIVNMVGDDTMIVNIKEFRVIVTGKIKIGLSFGVKNLNIEFKMDELFVNFGKLMEHDRLNNFFHNLINDLAIELLGDFWVDYGQSQTKKVEDIINKYVSGYSFTEIIGIISGAGSGGPIFGDIPGNCKNNVEPSVILYKNN